MKTQKEKLTQKQSDKKLNLYIDSYDKAKLNRTICYLRKNQKLSFRRPRDLLMLPTWKIYARGSYASAVEPRIASSHNDPKNMFKFIY